MLTSEEISQRLTENTQKINKRLLFSLTKKGHDDLTEDTEIDNDVTIPEGEKVRLSEIISEHFFELFSVKNPIKAPYRIFKGGRSSTKSSVISLKLVLRNREDENANTICFRKVAKYLSTSVYEQIKWAIIMLKMQDDYIFLKSPLRIIHKKTDTAFYFYGVDDPMKIKSAKIARGYVKDLWYEEAAEFESIEEIDTVNDTFVREELPNGEEVHVYFSYNPPRNPYIWINEWLEKVQNDDDYYIHHSTYEDVREGFLSKQFLRRVAKIKITDPDYHDWMYGGEVIGVGDIIYNYNLFQRITDLKQISPTERLVLIDIVLDTGYSTSATTFLRIGFTNNQNVVILKTWYYSPVNKVQKKAPSDFSKDLWDFTQESINETKVSLDTRVIDSADGALRNQFFKDYGLTLTPARKKKKKFMIETVEDLLAQGRVYVMDIPENQVFLKEHKKYQWDEKSLKDTPDDPKVIKVDDHTCDAFQYYVQNNLRKLGLKI